MDEQERDHFVHVIRELERSNRRWKFATFTLAAALAILPIMGLMSFIPMRQLVREQNAVRIQLEEARAKEAVARLEAEQARNQAAQRTDQEPKKE